VNQSLIVHAAEVLSNGGLVAFPTETVYGLGADAENVEAIQLIYLAKGRPQDHPVIVHVAVNADLQHWAKDIPDQAHKLIKAFWPGPLTLILKRQSSVPAQVSGGQDTIGLRCPAHPVAQALIQSLAALKLNGQAGVAAPSANLFGHVSPTLAEHVRAEFPERVAQGMPVLEGGASEVGIESTIVDLSRVQDGQGVFLLRPGGIGALQIEAVLGQALQSVDADAPRVSGSLKAHYAPRTPMMLIRPQFQSFEIEADAKADLEALENTAAKSDVAALENTAAKSDVAAAFNFDRNITDEAISDVLILAYQTWLKHHPNKRAVIVSHREADLKDLKKIIGTEHDAVMFELLAQNVEPYAHNLYATLRGIDDLHVDQIFWCQPPQTAEWNGVNDRLNRAAAAFS
jgi:L-threonylcarbamoyladenylate synthase